MEIRSVQHPIVYEWLEDVSSQGLLKGGPRRYELLAYIVREELEGRGENLKAYAIALDVLGRGEDFDPATDSIVRVEMARLRDSLELYYARSENPDEPQITIPKGSYRPSIQIRSETDPNPLKKRRTASLLLLAIALFGLIGLGSWATWIRNDKAGQLDGIAILMSARNTERMPATTAQILESLNSELRKSLSKRTTLTVLTDTAENGGSSYEYKLILRVVGIPQVDRISVELIDAKTSAIVWADAYPFQNGQPDETFDLFVARLADDLFPRIINDTKASLDERDINGLNPWELYLLSTWVPGSEFSTLEWEVQRRDFAFRAVTLDPELGQAHSVLADKFAYLSSVDADYHSEVAVQAARYHAAQALQYASRDTNTLFNLGLHHWHLGESSQAVRMLERLLSIDPNDGFAGFFMNIWPYPCDGTSNDVVKSAYDFDAQLGADNPIRWVTLTSLGILHMNRGEFELALKAEEEAHEIFHSADSVMRHAVILHALGRTQDAVSLIRDEVDSWPNLNPTHFSEVTLPRRCKYASDPGTITELYSSFAKAYRGLDIE